MADFESDYLPGGGLRTTTNVAGYPTGDAGMVDFFKQMAMQRMLNPMTPGAPAKKTFGGFGGRSSRAAPLALAGEKQFGQNDQDQRLKELEIKKAGAPFRMVPKKYVNIAGSTLLTDDWDAAPYWMRPQGASIQASPGPVGHGDVSSLEEFANQRRRTALEGDALDARRRALNSGGGDAY